jgi:hypothetical protein
MNTLDTVLLDDARQALLRKIVPVAGQADLQEAFAAWLIPSEIPNLSVDGAVKVAVQSVGAERTYQHVAVLGLAAQIRTLDANEATALRSGIQWVVGREPVVDGTPMGFCMDSIALAALSLGARSLADCEIEKAVSSWIQRCRAATDGGPGLGVWQEWLLSTVCSHVSIPWICKADANPYAAAIRVALMSRGIGSLNDTVTSTADELEVVNLMRSQTTTGLSLYEAVISLAALDWVRRSQPVANLHSLSAPDVSNLLRRLSVGFKKWTWEERPRTKTSPSARKWNVDNEYHVQNLLWFLLAPIFPDVLDEDSTPKVGPVQPRADIGIPSLRLIIEAKFMRNTDAPKNMVEQIAEDASLYLVAGSKYDHIVPFIWDDSRRIETHDDIIRGLRQIKGIVDAVVISKPGMMDDRS